MSDSAQILVDVDAAEAEATVLAKRVREWLVGEGVIVAKQSDCVLGERGHAPGPNAKRATKAKKGPPKLATNGLEIRVGRAVFDAGGNGLELTCAACRRSVDLDDAWGDAVGAWFEGDDDAMFACPHCGREQRLAEWDGPWRWGFGHLGFVFWNWPPLSEEFVAQVRERLGHRVVVVRQRV